MWVYVLIVLFVVVVHCVCFFFFFDVWWVGVWLCLFGFAVLMAVVVDGLVF